MIERIFRESYFRDILTGVLIPVLKSVYKTLSRLGIVSPPQKKSRQTRAFLKTIRKKQKKHQVRAHAHLRSHRRAKVYTVRRQKERMKALNEQISQARQQMDGFTEHIRKFYVSRQEISLSIQPESIISSGFAQQTFERHNLW